jgi:transcriptional regulator with XRE-family HTH domain
MADTSSSAQELIALDVTFSSRLGERLRAAREARGLSKSDLARRSGLSRKEVGYIETGRLSPRLSTLLRVLDALGTGSLQDLAAGLLLALVGAERPPVAVSARAPKPPPG